MHPPKEMFESLTSCNLWSIGSVLDFFISYQSHTNSQNRKLLLRCYCSLHWSTSRFSPWSPSYSQYLPPQYHTLPLITMYLNSSTLMTPNFMLPSQLLHLHPQSITLNRVYSTSIPGTCIIAFLSIQTSWRPSCFAQVTLSLMQCHQVNL